MIVPERLWLVCGDCGRNTHFVHTGVAIYTLRIGSGLAYKYTCQECFARSALFSGEAAWSILDRKRNR